MKLNIVSHLLHISKTILTDIARTFNSLNQEPQ